MYAIVAIIETKLRSLRVEYGRRLREVNKPSGSAGGKVKKWRFFDQLHFLRDCVIPRATVSNLSLETEPNENDMQQGEVYMLYIVIALMCIIN